MGDRTEVVTVFIERDDSVLLGRRSDDVRTYQGHWAGISGYLESNDPLDQARREIREETGFDPTNLELVRQGQPLDVDDGEKRWRVHPFRFRLEDAEPTPNRDREHEELRWVDPDKLSDFDTVPGLRNAWERVK